MQENKSIERLSLETINLDDLQVRASDKVARAECIMYIDQREVLTLGNFSAIIGKAKARKTFLATMFAASCVGKKEIYGKFVPKIKGDVLYIDTEQSRYHVQNVVKRIKAMAGSETNIKMFVLRPYSPKERVELIDIILDANQTAKLVILDGVRDLITNINSEEQSTEAVTHLMKWTALYDTHIMCIIHQNKADSNARGHIGTEIMNKSESVISVTKPETDNMRSIVKAEYSRAMGFDEFEFTIEDNIPVVEGSTKDSLFEETKDVPF